ncbi:MAG: AAA family ATPase [Gammaproteobacteria bacterium]|jgi:MoxR-like ATPase
MNDLTSKLQTHGYVADASLTTTLELMEKLQRPLLLEGEAGVGKTTIANTLAKIYQCELIRLQCYEGLDVQSSVYEWNYSKQLLWINLQNKQNTELAVEHIFTQDFLLERPLLKAIKQKTPAILLIDEIDRADEAFEAYLLELLSEYQISIPELGTVKAETIPRVILTSNGTRELSDALRRRCLYHYLDYPDSQRESLILEQSIPQLNEKLNHQIVNFIQALRQQDLQKCPGVAETLDWASALIGMGVKDLYESRKLMTKTFSCLLKTQEDLELIDAKMLDNLMPTTA